MNDYALLGREVTSLVRRGVLTLAAAPRVGRAYPLTPEEAKSLIRRGVMARPEENAVNADLAHARMYRLFQSARVAAGGGCVGDRRRHQYDADGFCTFCKKAAEGKGRLELLWRQKNKAAA